MAGSSLIGNLAVLLRMDTSAFERGSSHAQRLMARTQRQFQQMGQRIAGVGVGLSVGITAPFAALMRTAIPAAIESRDALAQVESALNSMGPAAGRTTAQLQAAASALQQMSLFDDDDILRKVTANLLTFGRVTGQVFDRAQVSIVNIAARLGTDLQSATLMVGRALNDPIRGMNALRRSGIQFTEEQQNMIRAMVEANNIAGAQAVMLGELERQFGGAAEAARRARPDAAMQQSWREFQEVVGEIALRVLPPLTDLLTSLLEKFNNMSPAMQSFVVGAAAIAAALGPVLIGIGSMISLFGSLLPLIVRLIPLIVGLGAALGPIALAAGAVYLAFSQWDELTGVMDRVNAKLDEMANGSMPRVRTIAETFSSVDAFKESFWDTVANKIAENIASFNEFTRVMGVAADFTYRFSRAVYEMGAAVVQAIGQMVAEIANWITNRLNAIWDGAHRRIEQVKGWFRGLYDAVVGNSYIPDMVDQIADHMSRLDDNMVAPAQQATERTAAAFADMGRNIIGTVQSILGQLRSGDFLGAAQGVMGIIGQISGLFGGTGGGATSMAKLVGHESGHFGGFLAAGGPVTAGRGYIVGERGPELFVPSRAGRIVANGAVGSVTIHQHYRFEGVAITQEEFVGGLSIIKQDTLHAIHDQRRRAG